MKLFLIFALAFAICKSGTGRGFPGPDSIEDDEFMCHDWPEPTVIDNALVCDGNADCPVSEWSRSGVSADESMFECHDPETEYPCDDTTVIPIEQKCDGHNDCPAQEFSMWGNRTRDEDLWHCKKEDQFICWEDEAYIDASKVCDGNADCGPSRWSNITEDEILYNCPEDMRKGKFICWGGEEWIDENLACDGQADCPIDEHLGIASDENAYDCATEEEFACSATKIIKKSQLCDGTPDCLTDDEIPERCDHYKAANITEFHCWGSGFEDTLPIEKMCDGTADCVARDEEEWICESESEGSGSEDSENAIFRRNAHKEREFNEYLEMRGINRRSLGMH